LYFLKNKGRIKTFLTDYFTVEDKQKKKTLQLTRKKGKFISKSSYNHYFYDSEYDLLPSGFINDLKILLDKKFINLLNIFHNYLL
jgi:hypothetical protein